PADQAVVAQPVVDRAARVAQVEPDAGLHVAPGPHLVEGLAQVVRLRGAVDAVAPGDRSADGAVAPAELGEPQGLVVAVAEHDVANGGDAAYEAPALARPGVERRAVVAVGVDRPPVEVALDAVLVELLGELVIGV